MSNDYKPVCWLVAFAATFNSGAAEMCYNVVSTCDITNSAIKSCKSNLDDCVLKDDLDFETPSLRDMFISSERHTCIVEDGGEFSHTVIPYSSPEYSASIAVISRLTGGSSGGGGGGGAGIAIGAVGVIGLAVYVLSADSTTEFMPRFTYNGETINGGGDMNWTAGNWSGSVIADWHNEVSYSVSTSYQYDMSRNWSSLPTANYNQDSQ